MALAEQQGRGPWLLLGRSDNAMNQLRLRGTPLATWSVDRHSPKISCSLPSPKITASRGVLPLWRRPELADHDGDRLTVRFGSAVAVSKRVEVSGQILHVDHWLAPPTRHERERTAAADTGQYVPVRAAPDSAARPISPAQCFLLGGHGGLTRPSGDSRHTVRNVVQEEEMGVHCVPSPSARRSAACPGTGEL